MRPEVARAPHPEAKEGEVWIGNAFRSDFQFVGWHTRRCGDVAYFANGTPIPKASSFCPVFVQRAELEAAGVEIPNDGGAVDHRWRTRGRK